MTEKGILAYFLSTDQARSVLNKLQALRAADLQVDSVGENPGHGVMQSLNPISSGDFPGLSSLTLSSSTMEPDAGVLAAADPDASGLADGGKAVFAEPTPDNNIGRYNALLTAVVDETAYDQALRVIQEAGGHV